MAGLGLLSTGWETCYAAPGTFAADGTAAYAPVADGTLTGGALGPLAGSMINVRGAADIAPSVTNTATTIVRASGSWLTDGMLNQAQKITVGGLSPKSTADGQILSVSGVVALTITFASALVADAVARTSQVVVNILGSTMQYHRRVALHSIELTAVPATNPAVIQICTPDGVAIPGLFVTFPTGLALPYRYVFAGDDGVQIDGFKNVGGVPVGGFTFKISGAPTALGFRVNYKRLQ